MTKLPCVSFLLFSPVIAAAVWKDPLKIPRDHVVSLKSKQAMNLDYDSRNPLEGVLSNDKDFTLNKLLSEYVDLEISRDKNREQNIVFQNVLRSVLFRALGEHHSRHSKVGKDVSSGRYDDLSLKQCFDLTNGGSDNSAFDWLDLKNITSRGDEPKDVKVEIKDPNMIIENHDRLYTNEEKHDRRRSYEERQSRLKMNASNDSYSDNLMTIMDKSKVEKQTMKMTGQHKKNKGGRIDLISMLVDSQRADTDGINYAEIAKADGLDHASVKQSRVRRDDRAVIYVPVGNTGPGQDDCPDSIDAAAVSISQLVFLSLSLGVFTAVANVANNINNNNNNNNNNNDNNINSNNLNFAANANAGNQITIQVPPGRKKRDLVFQRMVDQIFDKHPMKEFLTKSDKHPTKKTLNRDPSSSPTKSVLQYIDLPPENYKADIKKIEKSDEWKSSSPKMSLVYEMGAPTQTMPDIKEFSPFDIVQRTEERHTDIDKYVLDSYFQKNRGDNEFILNQENSKDVKRTNAESTHESETISVLMPKSFLRIKNFTSDPSENHLYITSFDGVKDTKKDRRRSLKRSRIFPNNIQKDFSISNRGNYLSGAITSPKPRSLTSQNKVLIPPEHMTSREDEVISYKSSKLSSITSIPQEVQKLAARWALEAAHIWPMALPLITSKCLGLRMCEKQQADTTSWIGAIAGYTTHRLRAMEDALTFRGYLTAAEKGSCHKLFRDCRRLI